MNRNFERAVITASKNDPAGYLELSGELTRWMDRWDLALSMLGRDGEEEWERFDIIAPTEALDELPQGVVSRLFRVRV